MKFVRFGYTVLGMLFLLVGAGAAAANIWYYIDEALYKNAGLPFAVGVSGMGIAGAVVLGYIAVMFLREWDSVKVIVVTQVATWVCIALAVISCVWFIVSTGYFAFAGAVCLGFGLTVGLCFIRVLENIRMELVSTALQPAAVHRANTQLTQ